MKKVRILQAKASTGARSLVTNLRERGLNALRTKVNGSTYRGMSSHLIVNWGRNEYPSRWSGAQVLNKPEAVQKATNKIKCFETLQDELSNNLPLWTTDKEEAAEWLENGEVEKVYCRKLTRASQGRGIHIANGISELEHAPLYVGGISTEREVRLHVFSGHVIDYAQKKKMSSERREQDGFEGEPNEEIRSHSNGWIFARGGVEIPESCKVCATRAIEILELDFGAIDMIITPQGVPKILEVNTAPGLEGTTLESYTDAIQGLVSS